MNRRGLILLCFCIAFSTVVQAESFAKECGEFSTTLQSLDCVKGLKEFRVFLTISEDEIENLSVENSKLLAPPLEMAYELVTSCMAKLSDAEDYTGLNEVMFGVTAMMNMVTNLERYHTVPPMRKRLADSYSALMAALPDGITWAYNKSLNTDASDAGAA